MTGLMYGRAIDNLRKSLLLAFCRLDANDRYGVGLGQFGVHC